MVDITFNGFNYQQDNLEAMKPKKPRLPKTPDAIRTVGDDFGNLLKCSNNGKRIIISLKLTSEQKHRRLGVINLAQKSIQIRRDRDKHLMYKFDGYGFNHKLLADSKLFDTIRLSDNLAEWVIPKQFILDNGKFLNFKGQGFELQTFVTLSQIEQFKKEPKF